MDVKPICPGCSASFKAVSIKNIGKTVTCPKCGTKFPLTAHDDRAINDSQQAAEEPHRQSPPPPASQRQPVRSAQVKPAQRKRTEIAIKRAAKSIRPTSPKPKKTQADPVDSQQGNRSRQRVPVLIAIAAMMIGVLGWWLFLKQPSPPSGFNDIRFGSQRYELPGAEELNPERMIDHVVTYMKQITENPSTSGSELFKQFIVSTDLMANYAVIKNSPLFFYDMYHVPDSHDVFYKQNVWRTFYGYRKDQLVYVRIYPLDEKANVILNTILREKYGDPEVCLPHYPTFLSSGWQWRWAKKGIAIRIINPVFHETEVPPLLQDMITLPEIPEEFSRSFIELIADEQFYGFLEPKKQ